jgi:hypothetical protein
VISDRLFKKKRRQLVDKKKEEERTSESLFNESKSTHPSLLETTDVAVIASVHQNMMYRNNFLLYFFFDELFDLI